MRAGGLVLLVELDDHMGVEEGLLGGVKGYGGFLESVETGEEVMIVRWWITHFVQRF